MTVPPTAEPPVYLRLRALLSGAILDGRFAEGDQLPSVRAFAAEHGANPLTVAKAYQSLQDDGYVSVRRGVGMFVADGAVRKMRVDQREQFLTETWPPIRSHIRRLGIDLDDLLSHEKA